MVATAAMPARAQDQGEPSSDDDAPERPRLTPPTLIEAPEIVLPAGAEPLPPDAGVVLRITIAADGTVSDVVIAEPLRDDVDDLVMEAARRLRFSPATRDGEPIPARIQFRFAVTPPEPVEPEPDTRPDTDEDEEPHPDGIPTLGEVFGPDDTDEDEEPLEFGAVAAVEAPEPGAATRITLRAEELTTLPGTFGEPLRVIASLPGVVRTPFGLGFFFVRGASFDNTGFFVDGFPVPLLYHLGAGPAVISSRIVSELDFYPGGYPARYGRFTAGVIGVETGAPDVESLHLEAEIDFLKASALAVVPFDDGRGTATAAFRRSYYELLLPLIIDGVELSYTDWQLRVDYDLTDDLEASLFYFGSDDSLSTVQASGAGVGDDTTDGEFGYGFQRLIGKLVLKLPDRYRLTWSGTVGFDDTLLRRTEPGGSNLEATIDGTYLGQRLELSMPMSEHFETNLGLDMLATLYDARTTFPTPPGLGEYPKPRIDATLSELSIEPIVMSASPYLEQVLRFDPVEITAALRLEHLHYGHVRTFEFDPRAVVRYDITDWLTAKVATGLFTQPPQPFQIARTFGNPTLEPQRSWQSSAGVEMELPEHVEIESVLYYSQMFDLPRNTDAFVTDEDGTVRRQIYVNDGEGRAYGWELLVRRRLEEGLYGWLSYTLSWSERFLDQGETVPFFFDQRHTLNLAVSYAIDGWRFGARFQLASGRPTRPVRGAEYDVDADRYVALRGGLTDRLPVYHQLDLRIDREFDISDDFDLTVYIDVLNVYYSPNSEGENFQFDFTRSERVPGLPTIGTLGVRLEYE